MNYLFRSPGEHQRLNALLARACPRLSRRQITESLRRRKIRVNGRPVQDAQKRLKPGSLVSAELPQGEVQETSTSAHSPTPVTGGFVVEMECSDGSEDRQIHERQLVALAQEQGLSPSYSLPTQVGGLMMFGAQDDVDLMLDVRAIVPVFPWSDGTLRTPKGEKVPIRVVERRPDQVLIELSCTPKMVEHIDAYLGTWKIPALADAMHGGIMVEGGARIRCVRISHGDGTTIAKSEHPPEWWSEELVFSEVGRLRTHTGPDEADQLEPFQVSGATARVLNSGHPWVIADDSSSDPKRFAPGTLVRLVDPGNKEVGVAQVDWSNTIIGRIWSESPFPPANGAPLIDRVQKAVSRRASLLNGPTNAFRLIHGESDGIPGLFVDRLGDGLRIIVQAYSALELVPPVIEQLRASLGDLLSETAPIIQVIQLRPKPPGNLNSVSLIAGQLPKQEGSLPGVWLVQEGGHDFFIDVGLNMPHRPAPGVGLFLDQRENRARIERIAKKGGHWLNLFCHTGAYSVAALAAGADRVTSVDLSRPYLKRLEENLAINKLDPNKNESVKMDVRRFLEQLPPSTRVRGIILDPPTAAAAGKKFWSVKKEVAFLIGACLERLELGGYLLVCRNDRRAKKFLKDIVKDVAQSKKISLSRIEDAPPGPDFPRIASFREGDSFQGVLAQRGS